MNTAAVKIMDEFNDDVQRLCEEIESLRDQLEEKEAKVDELQEYIVNHNCVS